MLASSYVLLGRNAHYTVRLQKSNSITKNGNKNILHSVLAFARSSQHRLGRRSPRRASASDGLRGIYPVGWLAYYILVRFIIRANHGADIERAIGGDFKGVISIVIYALGMLVALAVPVLSYFIYAMVSVIWFIPDRRLMRR